MKYHKIAKPIAFALAAMLAIPPVSASAITFADINQVPWPGAEVSINKAAELKLVVGETINGKNYFKPKDPVSLTQTCQLAYKLLLETGKAKADASVQEKWTSVMNTYKIQSWAHPAVSFCLDKGIVSISDLGGFISGEVNRSATREQAAEILGRALEVGVPAKKASATSTIFKDNANIAKDAVPYIALLNAEKIVNGDDLGKFNPKNTLNRTETAVMVTNLYNVLKNTITVVKPQSLGSQSGTVKDMNNLYVNFENSNAYFLYASTGATVTLNGSNAAVADIVALFKEGKTIKATLTLDANNRITKMAATCDAPTENVAKDTKGTLTSAKYDDEKERTKIELNKNSSYTLKEDSVYIEIDDREYDPEGLAELYDECKDEDKVIKVELTLNKDGSVKKVIGEVKREGTSDDEIEGEITKVDYDEEDEDGYVELDDDERYDFDNDTTIKIDGDKADGEELYELYDSGEELEAVITVDEDDDDYATEIKVYTEDYEADDDDKDSDEVSGKLQSITFDEDEEEVDAKIKVDGDTYETEDIDDVTVEVQDGDGEIDTWEELYFAYKDGKEIEVELVVDGDEVLEITGKVTLVKGILTGYGDEYLKVEGKKSEKATKYYFTEYDRSDEDEEEDWEDAAKDIDVSGLRNVSNLFDFYDVWLDDDPDLDEDVIEMVIKLDKDGFIVEIDAELD